MIYRQTNYLDQDQTSPLRKSLSQSANSFEIRICVTLGVQIPMVIAVCKTRAPDKVRIFILRMHISAQRSYVCHLFESSHQNDSNKWSHIVFGEEITRWC